MPNHNTSGNRVHSVPQTTVPSTTQTIVTYKYLGKTQLMRARFTQSPETYIISIRGTRHDGKKVEVSRIYDELHPLMAVGRAVVDSATITSGVPSTSSTTNRKSSNSMAGLVTYVLLLSVIAAVFGAVYSSPERKRRTEQWLNDKFENL